MRKYKTLKYVKHKKKSSKNRKPKRISEYHNGGGIEPAKPLSLIIQLRNIYKDFFDRYFKIFVGSELSEYIIKKYVLEFNVPISSSIDIELIKNKLFIDKIWNVIIDDLIHFFNILYAEIKQDVIDIHIFSVSTGTGFLEALFAIYLKIICEKPKVKIMFVDVIDFTSVLVDYKYQNAEGMYASVFDYVIGLLQKNGGSVKVDLTVSQLELIMSDIARPYINLRNHIIDKEFIQIDIFIAVHAQGIISHKFNGKANSLVKLVNLYVNLLTKSEENQKRIPMLWLYYGVSLNFKDKESLISSMQSINDYYIKGIIDDYKHYKYKVVYDDKYIDIDIDAKAQNFKNYFNLSTLDNLWKIGMDEIQKYPIPILVNI